MRGCQSISRDVEFGPRAPAYSRLVSGRLRDLEELARTCSRSCGSRSCGMVLHDRISTYEGRVSESVQG